MQYSLFHILQYLVNILYSFLFLVFSSPLLQHWMAHHRPAVQTLIFLLIARRNFGKLQICISFHHLMESLYEMDRCLKMNASVN